ncbi:MAG TPA: sulfite oxidase [Nitrososphaerales archaeon]|nr:sulfite oxidase [Nitrososphaerales archaeon]
MFEDQSALVPIESKPFNAETPMRALTEPITPTRLFYVRSHFDVPQIDGETWQLTVGGEVERQVHLSLKELKRLPKRTAGITMECAGNARTRMVPIPKGTPFAYGAVGTARFTGTPLSLLLDQATPRSESDEVLFVGADKGEVEPGRVEPFARSLPLDVARKCGALLVWAMNGEALLPEHGFPLRLVVPGWYGVASVKWLTEISILRTPFEGYFQREQYVYAGERGGGAPEGAPVTLMRVRAVIGHPPDGMSVAIGPVEIAGTAWSGFGLISKVEVSVDNGRSWARAGLRTTLSPHVATPWRFTWHPQSPGRYALMVRAVDSAGNMQPLEPVWNEHGYGNNAVHSVRITVR